VQELAPGAENSSVQSAQSRQHMTATCQAEIAAPPWSGGGFAASRERSGRPRVTEPRKGGSRIMLRNNNIEENFDMGGHL